MNDALPLFALAGVACSLALVIWTTGRVWLRAKELERGTSASLGSGSADAVELLARIDARLQRLEESVDATAIEVERIAEAQRFAARALATGDPAPQALAPAGRQPPDAA